MSSLTEAEKRRIRAELDRLPEPVIDDENPEWTKEDFARGRPPEEVLSPEILAAFPKTLAAVQARRAGRPKSPERKRLVTLRLDPEIVDGFRAGGPGWQTRINEALKQALAKA